MYKLVYLSTYHLELDYLYVKGNKLLRIIDPKDNRRLIAKVGIAKGKSSERSHDLVSYQDSHEILRIESHSKIF